MKAQHTQKDWRIGTNGTGKYAIFNKDYQIAQISAFKQGISEEEVKSNAKLIASAPFMLQTLIDMVAMESTPDHIKKYANDAIKQATE